ncbi:AP-5 complex subunit beta-1 [Scleropages formosus]|uniref:AP-5 complex subunit beta-1 n=1 Tax=Scleropages formosus TaxID=113540 RepID=A0A8C9QRQ4_SCLFO|nr:AP-5 complex subunit beta-1 [Scleropages formosus]
MASTNASSWPRRISSFTSSPSQFLSGTTADSFLDQVLHELRDDRISESTKVLLLTPFLEHPTILCPFPAVGEETAVELLAIFCQVPHKSLQLRCQLLVAITSVLVCTSCVSSEVEVAVGFLDLLYQTIQDTNDHKNGQQFYYLRLTACDCLREIETCYPGLLSQKLEALYLLKQQETTPLHQAYSLLYTLALKNAIRLLSLQKGGADDDLKRVLAGNEGFAWKAVETPLPPYPVSSTGQISVVQTSTDNKELKSIVSLLLEESYLLTPLSQATLLRELIEVVAMVQALSPAIFKSQLVRLIGTVEITLLHATLLMKSTFTDSLFTTEDENFFIKRLVSMAQHPLLSVQQKLFYMDCILHFPENRPISSNGEESLPVLVTPHLAASLLPTVFNDSRTMLCRLSLLSLVYLEADENDDKGVGYLFSHLMALHRIVENHGTREMTVTYFKSVFTFLTYFYHNEKFTDDLTKSISELYSKHCYLAPNVINLIDRIQEHLEDPKWSIRLLQALQKLIVELPLVQMNIQNLGWHLKILGRVSQESQVSQGKTLCFLLSVLINTSLCTTGDWKMGSVVLVVCRNLLQHPSLHRVFTELADLLQYIMQHYNDVDIQDHARFYYTLLTNLSREKLSGVLTKGPNVEQTKVRSLSSLMAESEGLSNCLTVQETTGTVLKLTKVHNTNVHRVSQQTDSEGHEGEDVLTFYRKQFSSPGFSSKVILEYHLTYAGDVDVTFDKLFSICLHFDLTDSNYEQVSDISVPCLFRNRKPPVVRVTLQPRQPYPSTLCASAMFTTDDGLSWHTQLEDIPVCFSDVFLPLPVPVGWSQEKREKLFDHLWSSMCEEEPGQSATSLFCFEIGNQELPALIESNFSAYLISQEPEKQSYKVMFFLPPQFHVLLTIANAEDAVQVRIATDNWDFLPFINTYLKSVAPQTPRS